MQGMNRLKAFTDMDDSQREPQPETVGYIVTIQEQYLGRVQEVAKSLESAGLTIDKVLGTLGQVVGHAQDTGRSRLAGVVGVESVERELRFGIAPPESGIQ